MIYFTLTIPLIVVFVLLSAFVTFRNFFVGLIVFLLVSVLMSLIPSLLLLGSLSGEALLIMIVFMFLGVLYYSCYSALSKITPSMP
ncbi:hypothetical protein ACE1TF_06915 [Geomicrobium sp. JSM 1781026]|uniref:hypothetical protein n=1 Tax=Geomicrobium sp. JSM 1781026 TaxID=3344580 RepID=UPI0035C0B70E